MGTCSSSHGGYNPNDDDGKSMYNDLANDRNNHVLALQASIQSKLRIPLEVQVAHFTPSSFPLLPIITPRSTKLCSESWKTIVNQEIKDEYGISLSGITVFYNEFYERLEQFDSSGRFEAVLSRHSSSSNRIAAKGAILVRIVKFVLAIDGDNKQTQTMLYMLGRSHAQKTIRPWQYSVFVQTLLQTIASRLGTSATNDVMEAWVNLFAFVLKSMLPPAIKGSVVETEININTSSEFDNSKISNEVRNVEEGKEMKKKFKDNSDTGSHNGSDYHDNKSDTTSKISEVTSATLTHANRVHPS